MMLDSLHNWSQLRCGEKVVPPGALGFGQRSGKIISRKRGISVEKRTKQMVTTDGEGASLAFLLAAGSSSETSGETGG